MRAPSCDGCLRRGRRKSKRKSHPEAGKLYAVMNKLHAVWAFSTRADSRPFLCTGLQGQLYEEHEKSGPDAIGLARELRIRNTKSSLDTAPVILNLGRYLRWLQAKV